MDLVNLDPKLIEWPDIRVTAYYDDGQEEMLRQNLQARGQQQPITVVKVGDRYYGTDGLHRWMMAQERGDATVPCIVKEGEEKDVFLDNLLLNSLHGKTRASEQVEVLGELFNNQGVSIEELVEKTGHGRDWVEKHITVSSATPIVRQSLDEELITLSHAYALARVEDMGMQERICQLQLTYRWSVKDLEGHIRDAKAIKDEGPEVPPPSAPAPPALQQCDFCKTGHEPRNIAMRAVCLSCGGALLDGVTSQRSQQPA